MKEQVTTLRRRIPTDAYSVGLKEAVERFHNQAKDALDPRDIATPRKLAAQSTFLHALGEHGPARDHPLAYSLWLVSDLLQMNIGHGGQLELGQTQQFLLANLGDSLGPQPAPETTLAEM